MAEQRPSAGGANPLAAAAGRAARSARDRARTAAAQLAEVESGTGTTVAAALAAVAHAEEARKRHHEAERRLVTLRLARAYEALGQDVLTAARRLAEQTLAEDVRRTPLDP